MFIVKYASKEQIETAYKQSLIQVEIMILQTHINIILHGKTSVELTVLKERLKLIEQDYNETMVQFKEVECDS